MEEYKTVNIEEATFLVCRGFNFIGKDKIGVKPALIFPSSQELTETVGEYHAGGSANAKELLGLNNNLKDYLLS